MTEHFRLLMGQVISGMGVFEGSHPNMILSCRLDLLRQGFYMRAGQFVRWSLQQGGPGIPSLHPLHYRILAGKQLPTNVVWENVASAIPDVEARNVIDEVDQLKITKHFSSHWPWHSSTPTTSLVCLNIGSSKESTININYSLLPLFTDYVVHYRRRI